MVGSHLPNGLGEAAAANASSVDRFGESGRKETEIDHVPFCPGHIFIFHFVPLVKIKILMLKCQDPTLQGCTSSLCWKHNDFAASASHTLHLSALLLYFVSPGALLLPHPCHNPLLTSWEA